MVFLIFCISFAFTLIAQDEELIADAKFVINQGNIDDTISCLERGFDINAPISPIGGNCLFVAISDKRLDFLKFLISKGANLNSRDKLGKTPFIEAADYYCEEIFDYLLTLPDLKINISDINGFNVLHMLAMTAQDRSAQLTKLISRGVNILKKDNEGDIPLHCAQYLESKTNRAALAKPFFDAIKKNRSKLLKRAAKAVNLLTIKDENGNNLLHCAMIYGTDEMVGFLLAINWQLLCQHNDKGEMPLALGVTRRALIDKIAQASLIQSDGQS